VASPITGRNGRLYVDVSAAANGSATPVANLNSFSVNQTTDRTEVTSFGDQTKTYIVGLKDAQGDFSGFWDPDGTLTRYVTDAVSGGRKFYIYPQSGSAHVGTYWFGTGHFDLTTTQTVGGAVEVSGSWAAATSVGYVQA
jgi:hypothetical protein